MRVYRFRNGWSQLGSNIPQQTFLLNVSFLVHRETLFLGASEYLNLSEPSHAVLYEFSQENFVRRATAESVGQGSVIPHYFSVGNDLFLASADGEQARLRRYSAGTLAAYGNNQGAVPHPNGVVSTYNVVGFAGREGRPMLAFSGLDAPNHGSTRVYISENQNNNWNTWATPISPVSGTRTFARALAMQAESQSAFHLLIEASSSESDPFLYVYRCTFASQSCVAIASRIGPVTTGQGAMILDASGRPVVAWVPSNVTPRRIHVSRLEN